MPLRGGMATAAHAGGDRMPTGGDAFREGPGLPARCGPDVKRGVGGPDPANAGLDAKRCTVAGSGPVVERTAGALLLPSIAKRWLQPSSLLVSRVQLGM